jgi:1-pyrroline-5-carboxylate dehydrogenase
MRERFVATVEALVIGDVRDCSTFAGAVIDARAFAKHAAAIDRAKNTDAVTIEAGGSCDDSVGYFVRPTVLSCTDPEDEVFTTEYFGPILGVHVFDDADYDRVLRQLESVARYALTGSIIARDRVAIAEATELLRFAAGNFYVNDKPTGAVVGQQPFGGARASGTNDKAGAASNLRRWTSTRTIKETFVPPTTSGYPSMVPD